MMEPRNPTRRDRGDVTLFRAAGDPDGRPWDRSAWLYDGLTAAIRRAGFAARAGRLGSIEPIAARVEKLAAAPQRTADLLPRVFHPYPCQDFLAHHAANVTILALHAARILPLDPAELRVLGIAAATHDLGMHALPRELVFKPAPHDSRELDQVRRHPKIGASLLRALGRGTQEVARIVLQGHEREDGRGYPEGLGGDRIALEAKIIAVADTLESMLHARPHRTGMHPFDALRLVATVRPANLCPRTVRAFVRQITPYPPGAWVRLSDGRLGRVLQVHPQHPQRPTVAVKGADGVDSTLWLCRHPTLRVKAVVRPEQAPAGHA